MLVTFPPSSALVDRVAPGQGYRRDLLELRSHPPAAIVVHTTGAGPVTRFEDGSQRTRHGWKCPGDAAAWIYGNVMDFSAHYVIDGEGGQLVQIVPEDHIAQHVGHSEYASFMRGSWSTRETAWWFERWPGKKSPLELAGGKLWTGGSCNRNTIGIEVAPRPGDPRGGWTDAAWDRLVKLLREVGGRYGIPLDREHVISHSDATPHSRSTAAGVPWDPGHSQWSPELLEHKLAAVSPIAAPATHSER